MKKNLLYFAYGSTLDVQGFDRWCQRNGLRTGLLKFKSTARLDGYRLDYSPCPDTRECGALSIQRQSGSHVQGVVFEIDAEGRWAVEQREGYPDCSKSIRVSVVDDLGMRYRVLAHRVLPHCRRSPEFRELDYPAQIREGMQQWGLSSVALDEAVRDPDEAPPYGLFTYGTLMRDESQFSILQKFGIQCVLLAKSNGRLIDLNGVPALVDLDSHYVVDGEFVQLGNLPQALEHLDDFFQFQGIERSDSWFIRSRVKVDVGEGRLRSAWVYQYSRSSPARQVMVSGNWRLHRGVQDRFLNRLVSAHTHGNDSMIARRLADREWLETDEQRDQYANSLLPLSTSLARGVISERKLAKVSGHWNVVPPSQPITDEPRQL